MDRDEGENRGQSRTASAHPEVAEWLRAVGMHWPEDLPQAPAMPKRLVRSVDEFGDRPENRDRRGLKVTARKTVVRTLRHIMSAVRRSSGKGDLAFKARRLLKSLAHIHDFDQTIELARHHAGDAQKAARRAANETAVCEAEEHAVGRVPRAGDIRLCRVVTVKGLQKLGRKLQLCVAHADEIGRRYHNELKKPDKHEFWSLCTAAGPFALLSVSIDEGTRRVAEFDGYDGECPFVSDQNGRKRRLSGALLRNVLRRLKADASDVEHFTHVGAFGCLLPLQNRAKYRDVIAGGRNFRVWRFDDEVIVASSRKCPSGTMPGRSAVWSRFVRCEQRRLHRRRGRRARVRRQTEWEQGAWHNEAMELGQFLELLVRSPELRDAFFETGMDERK